MNYEWVSGNSCCTTEVKMPKLSAEELLDQFSGGKRDFESINLRNAYLFQADLQDINFAWSDLNSIYLPYANLSQANLYKTQLNDAELGDAQLNQANLSEANLERSNLSRANLREANLQGANFLRATLQNADLRSADLSGADLRYANLSRVNLENAKLTGAKLKGCNLFKARNADLSDAECDRTTIMPDGYLNID
jgi:uncharacterized protein YjbI with pentapeptide repeats